MDEIDDIMEQMIMDSDEDMKKESQNYGVTNQS